MKTFIALLVLGLTASSLAKLEANLEKAKESENEFKEAHKKCQSNPATAISERDLRNRNKDDAPPANAGAYALCISKAFNWQNEDGSVNKAVIQRKGEAIFGNTPELQTIVDECAVAQENPEVTAQHIFKCYRKYLPRHGEHQFNHAEVAKGVKKVKEAVQKCQSNTNTAMEESAFKQVMKGGDIPANFGTFALCVSKALNWQNEDGSLNKSYIESRAQELAGGNDATYKAIVEQLAVEQETPEATAVHIFKSYRKYAPHH